MSICIRNTVLFIFYIFASTQVQAQKAYTITSPNGNITCIFIVEKNGIFYKINFKGTPVIQKSSLGLVFKEGSFTNNIKITDIKITEGNERYTLPVGRTKEVNDQYRQLVISLQQLQSASLKINIEVRAFNDGIAFRYQLPQWEGDQTFTLLEEKSVFNIAGDPVITALFFPNYTSSHEGVYQKIPVSKIAQDTLIDLPALFQLPGNIYMAITEASLDKYMPA